MVTVWCSFLTIRMVRCASSPLRQRGGGQQRGVGGRIASAARIAGHRLRPPPPLRRPWAPGAAPAAVHAGRPNGARRRRQMAPRGGRCGARPRSKGLRPPPRAERRGDAVAAVAARGRAAIALAGHAAAGPPRRGRAPAAPRAALAPPKPLGAAGRAAGRARRFAGPRRAHAAAHNAARSPGRSRPSPAPAARAHARRLPPRRAARQALPHRCCAGLPPSMDAAAHAHFPRRMPGGQSSSRRWAGWRGYTVSLAPPTCRARARRGPFCTRADLAGLTFSPGRSSSEIVTAQGRRGRARLLLSPAGPGAVLGARGGAAQGGQAVGTTRAFDRGRVRPAAAPSWAQPRELHGLPGARSGAARPAARQPVHVRACSYQQVAAPPSAWAI
jgi:hypothetical protein